MQRNFQCKIKFIFSDCTLFVDSWSLDLPNHAAKMDQDKLKYAKEVILLRKQFENNGGRLGKIPGAINKADLGFHLSQSN